MQEVDFGCSFHGDKNAEPEPTIKSSSPAQWYHNIHSHRAFDNNPMTSARVKPDADGEVWIATKVMYTNSLLEGSG